MLWNTIARILAQMWGKLANLAQLELKIGDGDSLQVELKLN